MPAAYAEVVRKIHINKEAGRSNDPLLVFKQLFSTFKPIWRNMERKSLNGHATVVGGHATVGRLSNNDSSTFHAIRKISEKSRRTVTRQWLEVTQPSADCQTTSLGRFKQLGKILKKSRWTFTRQWSEVTRPSADCQTTFFRRFKRYWKISKKVAERSRDTGRMSGDRRPTVKQRFLDVSSN